jgi:hypothetical protein
MEGHSWLAFSPFPQIVDDTMQVAACGCQAIFGVLAARTGAPLYNTCSLQSPQSLGKQSAGNMRKAALEFKGPNPPMIAQQRTITDKSDTLIPRYMKKPIFPRAGRTGAPAKASIALFSSSLVDLTSSFEGNSLAGKAPDLTRCAFRSSIALRTLALDSRC